MLWSSLVQSGFACLALVLVVLVFIVIIWAVFVEARFKMLRTEASSGFFLSYPGNSRVNAVQFLPGYITMAT